MATKREIMLKRQRRAGRLNDKQIHEAATIAIQHGFAIAMHAVKDVFKERASNPKIEAFLVRMMELWDKIGNKEVSIFVVYEKFFKPCFFGV